MFKVKMFNSNGDGKVIIREVNFYDITKAKIFFDDIKALMKSVHHAKLICHNRVVEEYWWQRKRINNSFSFKKEGEKIKKFSKAIDK